MLVVFLAAGGVITWLVIPPPPPEVKPPPPPVFEVGGERLPATADVEGEVVDRVRRFARAPLLLELPDGATREVRLGELGAEIDRARLARFIGAALEPKSPLARSYQSRRRADAEAAIAVPIPLRFDTERALALLLSIKDETDRAAADAVVDLVERKLVPERVGFRLDVYGTMAAMDRALRGGQSKVRAVGERLEPKVKAAALGNVEFDHVLGYFETRYSRSARARARTYNLRLAASRLDGSVLLPGEIFDFNETVGPRDEAHGYRVAPVIAEGELVDGIGGGTCQISGTLHGAAFLAGLDVVERYPHSRPSYYIKLGMDATVVYPTINFRFRNPFDFPIVLHQTVKSGVVRAEILGPKRAHTVTFFRRVDGVTPFEEVIRETDKLPRGTRVLVQRGMPGFDLTVFRVVRAGAYATREKRHHKYPPTSQIVELGTGPTDLQSTKKDDSHPEYVADHYLVITQGPGIKTPGVDGPEPGGGTVESRIPGVTGRYGWQEKVGMPYFRPEEEDAAEAEADG
ncbi:MAG: VanW family protein [Deltaproteobacteria bacterium]|nr:VanW family protein [Deltaproteobacteria bacterium]MBW2536246.1 VanW family protein [Deltaproteobacteria bacterium]